MNFQNENSPLQNFLDQLKMEDKLIQKQTNQNLEFFLQNVCFCFSDFFSVDQIQTISQEKSAHKFFNFYSNSILISKKRIGKTSWSFTEKKVLVWVVFHYLELTRRKFSELVTFIFIFYIFN